MESVIIVYKWLGKYATPVAEIRWTGEPPKNGIKFANKHGGDMIEIQTLDEYIETNDYCCKYSRR